MATHSCNYWMCNVVIQQGEGHVTGKGADDDDDGPWQAANALQLAMPPIDVSKYQYGYIFHSQLARYGSYEKETSSPYGFLVIPAGAIPNADMFQDFNKLSVLKVSCRTFSFSSPPFIYCHNLKFLWIDNCQDQDQDHGSMDGSSQEDKNKITVDGESTGVDFQRCLQRLWVLDVRYTCCDRILSARMLGFMTQLRELNVMGAQDWDIGQLQGQLPNTRKLRVTKSTVRCTDHSANGLVSRMNKMELLVFSGNLTIPRMTNLFWIITINNCCLETVIIDGCFGIEKISFRGCAKLKNLLLTGSFESICILDFSGTAVKILDLSTMIVPKLDELYLADCKELCAILWSPEDKRKCDLYKLHIDTTRSASLLAPREEEKSNEVVHGVRVPSTVNWIVLVRDARLLWSLMPFKKRFSSISVVHLEISSPAAAFGSGKCKDDEVISNGIKGQKILVSGEQPEGYPMLQGTEGNGDAPTMQWPCPGFHSRPRCYIHLQDHPVVCTKPLQEDKETATYITIPDIICDEVVILHVHHSLAITSFPGPAPALGSRWRCLEWCRVEQCPKMECVFTAPKIGWESVGVFPSLKTFWASRLPKARYIWNWSPRSGLDSDYYRQPFYNVTFLHVEFCPRLEHVLPLPFPRLGKGRLIYESYLYNLETLEIVWCSDLKEVLVFPLYTNAESNHQQRTHVEFPSLKHIHLHELPMLMAFCTCWDMFAPVLETIKIRGCWSLRRLPALSRYRSLSLSTKVLCYCEKEWWDRLQWGNYSHFDYNPVHSTYHKNNQLRGSVLT
ncbi:unnamed protein product [Urochloa humidicola]